MKNPKGVLGMKFFHTADWHLGKLVQGVYMTEDQSYVLEAFIQDVKEEKPDAIVIAGDLYDRAVPPTEAVHLLDHTLKTLVMDLEIPVLAIAGNHDSPSRLHFASSMMKQTGLHMTGTLTTELEPVVLTDAFGEVHFHLIPYVDPSVVRNIFAEDSVRTHDDAMKKIVNEIQKNMDPSARHIFVGHAFVTPYGEEEENTSDSERPLSIGGAEYVQARHFQPFHYTALGHLHQAHYVEQEKIRYSGSLLKYSISEEHHDKGYYVVEMDGEGAITTKKRRLHPRRDMRSIECSIDELLQQDKNDDYVFVHLTDQTPVLMPMEKVRTVYPNALHVDRKQFISEEFGGDSSQSKISRTEADPLELFRSFYKEIKGEDISSEGERLFIETLEEITQEDNDRSFQ